MEKKPNIALNGSIGAGKSAIASQLHDRFGYAVHSSGGVFRSLAQEAGVSVVEFQAIAAADPTIDRAIDEATASVPAWSGVVFDSRVASFFAQQPVFKVLVLCSEEVAARRVLNAGREDEVYQDVESAKSAIAERQGAERSRYRDLYGIPDYLDPNLYDLVIDSGEEGATPERIADEIANAAKAFAKTLDRGDAGALRACLEDEQGGGI